MRIQRIGVVWAVALLGLLPSCDSVLEAVYGESAGRGCPPCACEEVRRDPANYPLASASFDVMAASFKEFYEDVMGGHLEGLVEVGYIDPSIRILGATDASSGRQIRVSISTVTGRVCGYSSFLMKEDGESPCAGDEGGLVTKDEAFAKALPFLRYGGQPLDMDQYHVEEIDNVGDFPVWKIMRYPTHGGIIIRTHFNSAIYICSQIQMVLTARLPALPAPGTMTPRIGKEDALSAAIVWARSGNASGRARRFHFPDVAEGIEPVFTRPEHYVPMCYCPMTEGLSPLRMYLTWAVPVEYECFEQRVSMFVFVDSDSGKVAAVGWRPENPPDKRECSEPGVD